jgi:hypothetical protein
VTAKPEISRSETAQSDGDWVVRGIRARGYDLMFAPDELSDTAISAALRAQARFPKPFPAWEAYRKLVNGTSRHDASLVEYATGVGLAMSLAVRRDGRRLVRKPGAWVVQAAQDAMARVVVGSYPEPALWRAEEYGLSNKTYSRLRDALVREFMDAVDIFRGYLYEEASRCLHVDSQLP